MKIKLPKQVILERQDGRRYIQIIVCKMPKAYENCCGVYIYAERKILINKNLNYNDQISTLIHEYMHAINDSKRFAKSARTEHKIINICERPFFDLINAIMRTNLKK